MSHEEKFNISIRAPKYQHGVCFASSLQVAREKPNDNFCTEIHV